MPTQQGKCNPNFTKSQNNLKRKQNETTLHHKKHHQCVFTYSNYSLFAAHRIWESLYFTNRRNAPSENPIVYPHQLTPCFHFKSCHACTSTWHRFLKMSIIPTPIMSANTTANKHFYTQTTDRKIEKKIQQNNITHLYCNNKFKKVLLLHK